MNSKLATLYTAVALSILTGCSDASNSDEPSPYDNNPNTTNSSVALSSDTRSVHYLVDANHRSLYTFDKDTANISSCPNVEGCVDTWPAFSTPITAEAFGQAGDYTTYLTHPLYYFINDTAAGDIKGNNVKDVWHLIYPPADFTDLDGIKRSSNTHLQTYLSDANKKALYFYDLDTPNVSNCYDMCAQIWPIVEGAIDVANIPDSLVAADFGTTTRNDGTIQATYKSRPLYYFINDTQAGQTNGDWVKGVWHLVELNVSVETSVLLASTASRRVAYLVDANDRAIYTFDADDKNQSNCPNVQGCTTTWPAFTTLVDAPNFGSTGTHTTFFGHPLYYFFNDTNAGDVNGDNIKGVWHLIYDNDSFSPTSDITTSQNKRQQTYLTDAFGRALYVFDNDEINTSNCYDACEATWPIFDAEAIYTVDSGLSQSDFTLIERNSSRSSHRTQLAYKGKPLYYFVNDTAASYTKGDWVKGVWHLVEINATATTTTADVEAGKSRFLSQCNVCHGDDGRTSALGVSQIIADIDDATTVKTLLNYLKTDGSGKHAAMVSVAQGLSDAEIDNLSAYIATLP